MPKLGITIFRNGQEISVKSLKSQIRDALQSDLEEQLIQRYETQGASQGKEYKAMVLHVPGKRMFELSYDERQDEGGQTIRQFQFDELEDYSGVYGGKTYTAEISTYAEGGSRKTRRSKKRGCRTKKREGRTRKNFFLMKKYR